jgi:phosphoribosylformylglycinamidine cyclo-ligase
MVKSDIYTKAGVNIDLGDKVSKIFYDGARKTWENRKGKLGELIVPYDDFSGIRAINVSGLPEGTMMNIGFDGVGTKIEIAERVNDFRTIAYDLIAMICDDAVVRGAEPVLIGSILDVNSLGSDNGIYIEKVNQLVEGYVNAARDANVAIVNGEVAELGHRIGGYGNFNCNWGAAVVWFANKNKLLTGKDIEFGDALVGLKEDGFRSNGLSLVRKILQENYGENWHLQNSIVGRLVRSESGRNIADQVLSPSKIYTRAVVDMFGGYFGEPRIDIHGIAHITGGGVPSKLGRVLKPHGLGAIIDDPFHPSDIMLTIQGMGDIDDEESYRTWNMGQGMILISPNPNGVIEVAKDYNIIGKHIGFVTKDS